MSKSSSRSPFVSPVLVDLDWDTLRFPGEQQVRFQVDRQSSLQSTIEKWCDPMAVPFGPGIALARGMMLATPSTCPAGWRLATVLRQTLHLDHEPELYLFPSQTPIVDFLPNSRGCPNARPGAPIRLAVGSRIFEQFLFLETLFLLGRKVGQGLLEQIPLLGDPTAGTPQPDRTLLQLRGLWKLQEMSGDRFGLLCCQNLDAAGKALLKSISGLGDHLLRLDLDSIEQESIDEEAAFLRDDSASFVQMRLFALRRFYESERFRQSLRVPPAKLSELARQAPPEDHETVAEDPAAEVRSWGRRSPLELDEHHSRSSWQDEDEQTLAELAELDVADEPFDDDAAHEGMHHSDSMPYAAHEGYTTDRPKPKYIPVVEEPDEPDNAAEPIEAPRPSPTPPRREESDWQQGYARRSSPSEGRRDISPENRPEMRLETKPENRSEGWSSYAPTSWETPAADASPTKSRPNDIDLPKTPESEPTSTAAKPKAPENKPPKEDDYSKAWGFANPARLLDTLRNGFFAGKDGTRSSKKDDAPASAPQSHESHKAQEAQEAQQASSPSAKRSPFVLPSEERRSEIAGHPKSDSAPAPAISPEERNPSPPKPTLTQKQTPTPSPRTAHSAHSPESSANRPRQSSSDVPPSPPVRLTAEQEEALRDFATVGSVWVVATDDGLSERQRRSLGQLFGEDSIEGIERTVQETGRSFFPNVCRRMAISLAATRKEVRRGVVEDILNVALGEGRLSGRQNDRILDLAAMLGLHEDDLVSLSAKHEEPEFARYPFRAGDSVEVHLDGEWLVGTVQKVEAEGDLRIHFDTDDQIMRLSPKADLIRPRNKQGRNPRVA